MLITFSKAIFLSVVDVLNSRIGDVTRTVSKINVQTKGYNLPRLSEMPSAGRKGQQFKFQVRQKFL